MQDLTVLLSALGGLTGVAALITAVASARGAARKTELNSLRKTVEALWQENERLRKRIVDLEDENAELRKVLRMKLKHRSLI